MRCIHCRGTMVRQAAPFQVDREGYHLTFQAVPAWICSQCGEAYFEDSQVDQIQAVIRVVDEKAREFAVPA